MSLQLGFPFQMFLDRRDIGWGERWPREIDEALEDALFLIPVLTPAYFNSRFCQSEYLHFLERERKSGRSDLILPIYYVEADRLERARWSPRHTWVADVANRQYFDWRSLRLRSFDNPELVGGIENMATTLKAAIQKQKQAARQKGTAMLESTKKRQLSANEIDEAYQALSRTQRLIVFSIYTFIHPPEIAVDDFFEFLQKKYPDMDIETTAELFFRLNDLSHEGLLLMRPVGQKTTTICGIPRVAKILHERQHLLT